MGGPQDRRAKTKARLQDKLVQRRVAGGQALVPEDMEKLCEADLSRIIVLLHQLKWPWNLAYNTSTPWTSLIAYLDPKMEEMDEYMQRRHGKQEFIGGDNKRSDREQDWIEAKVVFARLKTRVAQLPTGCMLHDVKRLHFRSGDRAGRDAASA